MTEPTTYFIEEIQGLGFIWDLKKDKVIFFKYEGDEVFTIDHKDNRVVWFSNVRTSRPFIRTFNNENEVLTYFRQKMTGDVMKQ